MAEIKDGFSNMRSNDVHHGDEYHHPLCSCQCDSICTRPADNSLVQGIVACPGIHHIFKRSRSQSLCPTPLGSLWYKISCVKGECTLCGFHRIPLCDKELDPTNPRLVSWQRFEKLMVGKTKDSEMKELTCLEHKRTNPRMFLAYATPKVCDLVLHNHVAQWQDSQYKLCLKQLREGEIMSLIDFAENYSFKG